jgi:hypothetical protein
VHEFAYTRCVSGRQLTVVAKVAMSTTMIFEHTRIPNAPCMAYLEVVVLANCSRDDIIGSECNGTAVRKTINTTKLSERNGAALRG